MTSDDWREAVRSTVVGTRVELGDALAHVEAALTAGASPLHAGDLALAFAASHRDPVATRRFEALVAVDITNAVRAIDADPTFVDEIGQRTRVHLLVPDEGDRPRLVTYRGTGPLRAWVAIAAQRMALNARRGARREVSDDVLADLVDREPDPEVRHLKELYRGEFRKALTAALAELADRARALLRLRFVGGLDLAQIGQLYHVHESTASRWIAAALDDVAKATRRNLAAMLSVTPETADSVARIVQSQLDLSIARLLC